MTARKRIESEHLEQMTDLTAGRLNRTPNRLSNVKTTSNMPAKRGSMFEVAEAYGLGVGIAFVRRFCRR